MPVLVLRLSKVVQQVEEVVAALGQLLVGVLLEVGELLRGTVCNVNERMIQCCGSGSGSTGSTCFWASRIRIHESEV